ncbi:pitrilysin family protein [Desulfovibrio sp.]|uniref:M16 family metallopeptidase n=1 Tax=Desulfovibrio sp. TaxID=885 RepID=UPI0023D557C7|nr:pitrilysin family protein [Desulfovibrio sp.]MDE7241259.1 insulinase family protein [Desulfovibrio sp.]
MQQLFLILALAFSLLVPAAPLLARDTAPQASAPQAAAAHKPTDEAPARQDSILTRLPNGLLVYILRDARFPLVCTRLYVRAGSANEEPEHAGISHVLEHMVFKGTEHRPKGQVAKDVEALGGYLNAATSFDKTWYLTDMPAKHWRVGMEVVKEMAFQPTLDAAELEAEKGVVISELQRGEDSPQRKLYENLQTAALHNTPYGRPIIGYADTIRAITVADLRAYIARWYQPDNMMLLVAGDIEPSAVLAHAQELFGGLANSSDLAVPGPLDLAGAPGGPQVEVVRGPWNKVYLGMAFPAPGLRDLRSVDLDVLCYLLGGDGTSPFYRKYKYERQLVDSISVGNMSLARAGLLTVTAQLDADKVETFWTEITRDLAALSANDFTPEAVARAKFNLEDSMDRAGETLNGLASWKGTIQFDLGGEQAERNLRFTQRNVDTAQLQNAIGLWFDPALARVRVLAPEAAPADLATRLEATLRKNWTAPQAPPAGIAKPDGGKARETIDLGSGRTVILIPDATVPYVSLDLLFTGGNALLEPTQQGLADLTARLLSDGCAELDAQGVERWLAERAASAGASAGLQSFGIALTGPSRFNAEYFGFLRDMIASPRFETQELRREVENMQSAIRQRADRPLSYMFARVNPFLFPHGQAYGYDSLGTPELLAGYDDTMVRDFWRRQAAQPWVLSVAGTFDREAVIAFARSLPVPTGIARTAPRPQWGTEKNLALTLPGRNQAHLLQIFPTVPLTHPDAPALLLLQSVLSGQSGLLFTKLRDEQGLGYTVTAFNRNMPEAAFMAFYIGTTPDKLAEARKGFAEVIGGIREQPLPAEVLRAGANSLLGEYLRERQSLASRAGEAATDALLHYPQDFQKTLLDKAATLTPADVQAVARKYLVPGDAYDVTLLP